MAEDNTIKLVDDFVNYIRDKYKEHFITNFDSMFGPVEETEAGFNMFVKEDGTVLADRLYLKPESQKKGIGTSIVQEMFDWSNKNNQPFEFILMAGYEDLSSPSKTVQTQKAFQEKLKDVPGLEAFPSEQGLLDTNITTYKYTPQLDTPTNVVDDFVITQDRFGRDVTVPVDNNGNIILYRATDDPNRIIDSDFRPLSRDKGSVGLGQQSYFSPNPMYSHKYQSSGRKNYKFATQIKPNQILPTDDIVKNYPELVNALNIPEEFTNQNWRQLVNDNKAMIAMGYETGGKRFFNDNIQTFINNGIQAFGSGSTGTGGQTFIEYEIIPLVKEGDTLGIKPIATLQTKEGFAAGKVPEAFTETLLDTPTNVVDDAPLLETRFNYTSDVLDVPVGEIDEWADDVIKPNKVFNPDSFTRYTREGKEYIWNRTTSFDAKELYERILKNRASDEDITKFFIYLASHSPSTAYAHKPYFQADALSDIVKIGIFSDKPITEVIPMGVFNDEAFFLDRLQSRNSELGPEINKVLVELVTEQGQFTNLKERMRNVIIDAHNKIYKNNPNDYFVLWRGGKLNRFYPWQSMSKSPSSAQAVSYQMNQLYGAGDTVETYLIHKNNMIDLDALGLSFSNEQEIIVLAEAANKPSAKLEQVLIQDDVNKINVSDLPKNGFEIENISKPLADAGQASQDFFDDVVKGINEKYRPKSAYEQIIDLNNPDIYKWQDDYNKLVKEGGNFNQHIFTSIPTFYETQIIKGLALSNLLNKQPMPDNLLKGRYQVLDIGGTEGTWAKALAKNNPNFYVEVLDPLKKAQDVFEEGELVTNAIFRREAFSYVLDDQDKIFDAKAFQPVRFAVFNEVDKYDVVHESMAFQFMDKNRAEQIKFIKENLLNENGIIIIEEKFANNDAIYKANEELKNTFKSKYYTPEQLQDKKFNVLLDMEANQISVQEIEKILGENFANVEQYWDAGNFKGYIASDSDVVNQFVPEINNLEVSLTNHRFSTAPTEKEIKVAVQNKMQQGGTDSKLAAQLAQETVAKNPKLYNTLAKTLTRFGVLGGTALAGLGKIAPALAPGDVAIEKAIEKAVPYLDDAASKLGFGRLKFGNILPTYIAYEIGVALADVAQAALYADSSAYKYREGGAVYNELRQPELDATGKPVKVLGMSAYDYFQTPPGKKQLEEFDFGSQFMNELDQEKISKYSPGWGLTKGLMFLIGEAYKSGTDQTTSDYTTKLKENPASIYNAGFTGSNK